MSKMIYVYACTQAGLTLFAYLLNLRYASYRTYSILYYFTILLTKISAILKSISLIMIS